MLELAVKNVRTAPWRRSYSAEEGLDCFGTFRAAFRAMLSFCRRAIPTKAHAQSPAWHWILTAFTTRALTTMPMSPRIKSQRFVHGICEENFSPNAFSRNNVVI